MYKALKELCAFCVQSIFNRSRLSWQNKFCDTARQKSRDGKL